MITHEIRLNAAEHERFCKAMHEKMRERGLTPTTLAEAIGVSVRSIYNFEKDTTRNPSKFLASKISNYLEMKPSDYKSKTSSFFCLIPLMFLLFTPLKVNAEPILDIPLTATEQTQIREICESKNISFPLVLAIIEKESTYNAKAINSTGTCLGAMQLNPRYHDIDNPFDLLENVDVATDYLMKLSMENDDICWVLDAYNGNSQADANYEKGVVSKYAKYITKRAYEIEQTLGY